jgi:hypothetical protein
MSPILKEILWGLLSIAIQFVLMVAVAGLLFVYFG